jgi:DNA primase large subunit
MWLISRPDLRARFIRSETQLFKHRFESDDKNEKAEFLKSLQLNWVEVSPDEKRELEGRVRRRLAREEGAGGETFFKVSLRAGRVLLEMD